MGAVKRGGMITGGLGEYWQLPAESDPSERLELAASTQEVPGTTRGNAYGHHVP